MYVKKFRKQQREVFKALTIRSAERNVDKLENNQKKGKKAIEEGRAILERLMNECLIIFVVCIA